MDPKDLFFPLHQAALSSIGGAQRAKERQQFKVSLEGAITAYRPDALDASDFLDAIAAGLKLRYEDPTEVLLHLSLAKEALDRLDHGNQVDVADALTAYEQMTDRRRM